MKNFMLVLCSFFQCSFCFSSLIQENSLLSFSADRYSQRGEDGIIREILSRLSIQKGFFVEFGASDGIWYSNTRALWEEGWSGIYIEANSEMFHRLARNYEGASNILCVQQLVTSDPEDKNGKTLDDILDEVAPNQEVDYLSIDIDGLDYLILETLKRKPKIILIEGGFGWNPKFSKRVPEEIASHDLGQPLSVMFDIGRKQGYQPVCFTQNTFFIRNDLYEPFQGIINDPVHLWRDAFYFMPELAQWIIQFREINKNVRELEGLEYLVLKLKD